MFRPFFRENRRLAKVLAHRSYEFPEEDRPGLYVLSILCLAIPQIFEAQPHEVALSANPCCLSQPASCHLCQGKNAQLPSNHSARR
ncbi:MAG: hypothetical protein J4400_00880 [Candidatus Aenigmarchaeota archaeon]|nr:hypothetical protein [Candidatus Aenigmarchaeota archaeon]